MVVGCGIECVFASCAYFDVRVIQIAQTYRSGPDTRYVSDPDRPCVVLHWGGTSGYSNK